MFCHHGACSGPPRPSPGAWQGYFWVFALHRSKEGTDEALRLYYKAVELDPEFAAAHAAAALCFARRKAFGWVIDPEIAAAEARTLARLHHRLRIGSRLMGLSSNSGIPTPPLQEDTDPQPGRWPRLARPCQRHSAMVASPEILGGRRDSRYTMMASRSTTM